MKVRVPAWLILLAGAFFGGLSSGSAAAPPNTAFSYQGHLSQTGTPANGRFDIQFGLFHTETLGNPSAASLTNIAVLVSNGVFTTLLDFGTNVFSGTTGWLEIGVRPSGELGSFVALSPRQLLTPTPYALYTLRAGSLTGPLPDSQLSTNVARLDADQMFRGSVTFGGPVRVGTSNSVAHLEVQGTIRAGAFNGDGAGLSNVTATAFSARQMERLWRVSIPFVSVTNAGNEADVTGKGAVATNFRMGKYEVNNNQYVAFLNAVAADDPQELYTTNMSFDVHGGIERSGSPGEYAYAVKPGMGHRPVVWVDFYDALRFCNWLHNGQPFGPQDGTTTEDGAYSLTPEVVLTDNVLRNPGARFWLPSDDEWYKAAYHEPFNAGGDPVNYWLFPTRSNDVPFSEPPPGYPGSVNACCETARMATDVGSYIYSPSYYGTFDQAGNVQEWTEWTSDFTFFRNRRLRGGSWYYNEYYSKSTDFEFDTTDYDADSIGFRVAGSLAP